jgi:N-acetyl sugar amidotransferase
VLDIKLEKLPSLTNEQWDYLLDKNLDHQLIGRTQTVSYCTRCVQTSQRPRMLFDQDGVCSACLYWDKKPSLPWKDRESELAEILDRHRSKDGAYDVIVPGSGGKDSAYVTHQLKTKWGMHPLTVTWSPFAYTEIGYANFQAFIQSGFDNLLATPNGYLHRKLTLLSTALVGDPFLPFIWGQVNYAFHVAKSMNVPLVFFGENGEAEYGGSSDTEELSGMPITSWSQNYFKGTTPSQLLEVGVEIGLISPDEAGAVSQFYFPPNFDEAVRPLEHYWYGYFTDWKPQENFFYTAENTGFRANPEGRSQGTYSKYASIDDRIDGFHYYFGLLKFGVGRATSDAAHEIREGLIDRSEAVELVRQYELEFPSRNFDYFLEYSGLTPFQFEALADKFRSEHLWVKKGLEWELNFPVWG